MVFKRTELARWRRIATLAASLAVPGSAFAAPDWYFQAPVTPVAREIITLHDLIFWICVVIFIGVFGTMFYSLFKHRKSVGQQAGQFHQNTTVEGIWASIALLR